MEQDRAENLRRHFLPRLPIYVFAAKETGGGGHKNNLAIGGHSDAIDKFEILSSAPIDRTSDGVPFYSIPRPEHSRPRDGRIAERFAGTRVNHSRIRRVHCYR